MRSAFVAAGLFAAAAIAKPLELVKKSYTTTEPCASGPTGTSGAPGYGSSGAPSYGTPCMTKEQAQHVAQNFETLISYYSEDVALASLTVDFTDWSDSVNTLINGGCTSPAPLGAPTFTDRAGFMAGQGAQPNNDLTQLNLWYTCDTVIFRWRTTVAPGAPQTVTGIVVLETVPGTTSEEPFLIKTAYSEFNTGAWLVDIGTFVPPVCPAPPPPGSRKAKL